MEMEFKDPVDGNKVVLRAIHWYPPKIVSPKNMEAILQQGDIEWEVECLITERKQPEYPRKHPNDSWVLLCKYHIFFLHSSR